MLNVADFAALLVSTSQTEWEIIPESRIENSYDTWARNWPGTKFKNGCQLPIQSYDGNHLTYHVFRMSFDHIVYLIKDYQYKLTQLLRFTTGDAHVNRLSRYHANRWRKYALDFKENNNDYPDLKCLVKFIKRAAADANPVYGFKTETPSEKSSSKGMGYSHMTSGDCGKSLNTFMGHKFRKHSCSKCKGEHR